MTQSCIIQFGLQYSKTKLSVYYAKETKRDMKIGEKIKHLRMQYGLTQDELAGRCGLSKGFISQLENDITSPSIATLVDILTCLGTDLKTFFDEEQEKKVTFGAGDCFVRQDPSGTYEISWIIPDAQKNSMEPIRVSLEPGGCTSPDSPHEGEEFGYVLSGQILLHLGTKTYRVKKGESFYFTPFAVHYLENPGKSRASVLWISSPPSF